MKTLQITLLAVIALLSVVTCIPQPIGAPVPDIRDGLQLSSPKTTSPKYIIDMFIDLTCSDTSDLWTSFYRDFTQKVINQDLPVVFHIHNFPLPYHIAAFEANKAYILVNNITTSFNNYLYKFVDECMQNQYPLLNVDTMNQQQIQEMIYDNYIAKLSMPITKDVFMRKMNLRETWDHGRKLFKLATSKAVFGTPMFFINGVQIYNADSWSADDWWSFINQ